MTNIKFKDSKNNEVTVETSEEIAEIYADLERQDKNDERRETRRHVSLNKKVNGCDFDYIELIEDRRVNIEEDYIKREEIDTLRDGTKSLLPEQQKLLYQVFYEERSIKSLAEEYGVSSPAIINRLKKIYAQLRKKF